MLGTCWMNPGNFRFTTTILNDTLTLSFQPSPFSPLIDASTESTLLSPSYSPVLWDGSSASTTNSIAAPATGYLSISDSNSGATSEDSELDSPLSAPPPREVLSSSTLLTGDSTKDQGELETGSFEGGRTNTYTGTTVTPSTLINANTYAGTIITPSALAHQNAYAGTTVTPTMLTRTETYLGTTITPSMLTQADMYAGPMDNPITSIVTETLPQPNTTQHAPGTTVLKDLILTITTLPSTIPYDRRDGLLTNDRAVSNADAEGLMLLATVALDDAECNISHAPVLDPNREGTDTRASPAKENVNVSEVNENEPHATTKEEAPQGKVTDSNNMFDVFFVYPMSVDKPPISTMIESDVKGSRAIENNDDMPMFNLSDPSQVPTSGTILYHGLSRVNGKTTISFEGLTKSKAEAYLLTDYAKYNDYHSVYMPNIVYAIESYCFCQNELITNDWNVHLFHDRLYPGHPVISGGVKLPTGGPHLGPSNRAKTINCDNMLHIKGGLAHKNYLGHYDNVNPFLSESEAKRLNSYAAIAEAHREPELASKILDTLLMPFPNEDIIGGLTESGLLNVRTVHDILHFAFDRDLVLWITQTGLVIVATSPFWSNMFDDVFMLNNWYVLPDIDEKEEEEEQPKPKKFFL
ncbi:hypothetical protein DFH29DRAFT_876122 [Suillus ampliporus]|nr:hypothetical protein DFH29DRAFT_876122 [Suillus ampliporus]